MGLVHHISLHINEKPGLALSLVHQAHESPVLMALRLHNASKEAASFERGLEVITLSGYLRGKS